MIEGAHPNTVTEATPAPAGVGSPSPAATPVVQPQSPAPVAPAAAPQAQTIAEQQARHRLSADTDDIPNEADILELTPAALKKRLDRANRSHLMKAFGTDSVEDIMKWKQQAESAAAREEEQRLAQMTEAERYKVQWEKEQMAAQHWRTQYETLQESYVVRDQDRQITTIASQYVHPKLQNALMSEFAQHVQGLDENEIGDPQEYADGWFRSYVEQNPEFGVPRAGVPAPAVMPQQVPQPPPTVRQVPFTNGVQHGRPAPAPQNTQVKTLAPGQANSMTDDEVRAWKRANGFNF
jgi:hypothetical protein